MSPETLIRNEYNHRTDLWALGVLYYEMIFGIRLCYGRCCTLFFNGTIRFSLKIKTIQIRLYSIIQTSYF
jgi:serine/threonine protein kinase